LFGLLTGETPYPPTRSVAEALRLLQHGQPRRLRTLRPDAPQKLDNLIDRMLQRDPTKRPALPITVMNALLPFTTAMRSASMEVLRQQESATHNGGASAPQNTRPASQQLTIARFDSPPRVLVVD